MTVKANGPNDEMYTPMLKKKGWITSSHREKSSNDGIKFSSSLPCAKLSTVLASTPKLSILASMYDMIAAESRYIPPKLAAACPMEKNMNKIAPKSRLALNLNGWA